MTSLCLFLSPLLLHHSDHSVKLQGPMLKFQTHLVTQGLYLCPTVCYFFRTEKLFITRFFFPKLDIVSYIVFHNECRENNKVVKHLSDHTSNVRTIHLLVCIQMYLMAKIRRTMSAMFGHDHNNVITFWGTVSSASYLWLIYTHILSASFDTRLAIYWAKIWWPQAIVKQDTMNGIASKKFWGQ